jgi:hypothetical protein
MMHMWPEVEAKTLKRRKSFTYMFFNQTSCAFTLTRLNCMKQKYMGLSKYLNRPYSSVLCFSDETWRRTVLSRNAFRHILSIGLCKGARFEQCDRNFMDQITLLERI